MTSYTERLSDKVVLDNFRFLSALQAGDKVVVDEATGVLSKEDRVVMVTLRRYWTQAFNTEAIEATFKKAVNTIESEQSRLRSRKLAASSQAKGRMLSAIFIQALQGVAALSNTYKANQSDQVADALMEIHQRFYQEFARLGQPSDEKAKQPFTQRFRKVQPGIALESEEGDTAASSAEEPSSLEREDKTVVPIPLNEVPDELRTSREKGTAVPLEASSSHSAENTAQSGGVKREKKCHLPKRRHVEKPVDKASLLEAMAIEQSAEEMVEMGTKEQDIRSEKSEPEVKDTVCRSLFRVFCCCFGLEDRSK